MQISLPRIPRTLAAALVAVLACSGAVLSASAASAETRSGDVTITIPDRISIDGGNIPVTVTSSSLYRYLDDVAVGFYTGTTFGTSGHPAPNTASQISTSFFPAGQVVARIMFVTTSCDYYSTDPCHYDSSKNEVYEFVNGLTEHDSNTATAKYASKVALSAIRTSEGTQWKIAVTHYDGLSWVPWPGATATIAGQSLTTGTDGLASWTETSSALNTYVATVAESDTVWSSSSAAVTAPAAPPITTTPAPTKSSKPGHVTPAASATKTASAMKKGLSNVRKVVPLTKKNDVNKLLGKKNGYTSAAVLYDKRTSCSDGPGVDCGATIEKFSSTAKAKARAKHIQKLLKKYSFLGTEYDTVHGHFLLRVSGDLTKSQAGTYKATFSQVF